MPGTRTFRTRLLPVLFLVFLGMVLTTGISYFHTKRTTEELAAGQMIQALGFLNREADQRIRAIRFELGIWSKEGVFRLALLDGYLGNSARAAAGRRLADRLEVDIFDRALLADRNGDVVATSDPRLKGVNVSQRGYYAEAMRGQSSVRGYDKGLAVPSPVLVAAAPVFEQDGGVGGLLALVLDVAHFGAGILDTLHIGRTGGAFFLDADNTVLVAPSWKQEGQFSPDAKSAQALRASNGTRMVRYESGGVMRMAVAQPNQETGWLVVVEASEDDILTRARNVAALNTLVAMCVLGLVAVAMAALRKAGASLEASEASYRILAETTPVGIATFDRQGRNTYANARAQDILGLAADHTARPFWEGGFETREGQPLPQDQLPHKQTQVDGQPRLGVVVWRQRQDGGRAVLSLSAAPLQAQGHPVHGAVLVLEDVTERMRIQEMMVQTEKMLSVGGLAAGMAHEINNPLASILQALQVVNRRLDPGLPANAGVALELGLDLGLVRQYMERRGLTDFLRGMHEAGVRAARIVSNMLGFSRKSGGECLPCSLPEILDKAVELASGDYDLKKQYDFRHIEIIREFEPDMEPVDCQGTEMEQVFFNILKNAAQALKDRPEGSPPPRITLRVRPEKHHAVVEVEDNGPGMSEEVRRRAFEPFFTTKDVGVGTGLGLSVVFFIVAENHKGSVAVESAPGGGTRFVIRLPYRRSG